MLRHNSLTREASCKVNHLHGSDVQIQPANKTRFTVTNLCQVMSVHSPTVNVKIRLNCTKDENQQ